MTFPPKAADENWPRAPRRLRKAHKNGILATIAGSLFLFVTFTTSIHGGGTGFLVNYTPLALLFLLLSGIGVRQKSKPVFKREFLAISAAVLLAGLSVSGLQYTGVFLVYFLVFALSPSSAILRDLPKFAYLALVFNIALYFSEIILVGQLGFNFDPAVFNYGGVGREAITTTWGFQRFAGHQAEPGYFATNVAALAVLSLIDGSKPKIIHWLAVLSMLSALSLTAAIMAVTLTSLFLTSSGLKLRAILLSFLLLGGGGYLLVNFASQIGLNTVDYFTFRLAENAGQDSSIAVRRLIIEDILNRDLFQTLFGNRHEWCGHCIYSRSVGFAMYMVFEGGIVGLASVFAIYFLAISRHGYQGFAVVLILSLMRGEFFWPQTVFILFVISTYTRPNPIGPKELARHQNKRKTHP